MTIDEQFEAIMERYAIRAQIENYVDALNHRDWERFGDTLTEDLEWSISAPFDASVKGREAMLHSVKTLQEPVYDFVFQMCHGIVVHDVQGNVARARHTLHEQSSDFMMIGIYYDELHKESDGIWRFARRRFMPTYHEIAHPRGKVYRRFPDPGFTW